MGEHLSTTKGNHAMTARYSDLSDLRAQLYSVNCERAEIQNKLFGDDRLSDDQEYRLYARGEELSREAANLQSLVEDMEGDLASAERSADRADYGRRVL